MPNDGKEDKPNKPDNSQFKQLRLPAWQPVMNPPHVMGCLAVLAAIFLPIGIAIISGNSRVVDEEWQYDDVASYTYQQGSNCRLRTDVIGSGPTAQTFYQGCRTAVNITIDKKMEAPVYLYYKLTNFYQNHRRFAKSRNHAQNAGSKVTKTAASDCAPFITAGESDSTEGTAMTVNGGSTSYGSMVYAPCGLVAWSKFNDSFTLFRRDNATSSTLICEGAAFFRGNNSNMTTMLQPDPNRRAPCTKSGITWDSDHDKFQTPELADDVWTADRAHYGATTPPSDNAYFLNGWYANEPGHEIPVTTDEDTMVWMRTASLPTFRKLYRIINVNLDPGEYTMFIDEYYDSQQYGGKKFFALATISWVGGKNSFLGIAYVVVGGLAVVVAAVFFVIHKINGDRTQVAIESLNELM